MMVSNSEVAEIFETLADLLEIESANPFRVRAYRNAARNIRSDTSSIAARVSSGEDLSKLPGIGKDLAKKINTIVTTGKLPLLQEVQSRTPAVLSEMMQVEGLGPQRVKTLYQKLNIRSFEDLLRAARCGQIRSLPGFSETLEATIQQRVEDWCGSVKRCQWVEVENVAGDLTEYLTAHLQVIHATVAGSFRRCRDTVGDLDIVVAAKHSAPVMQHFIDYESVDEVISQGLTRASVRLHSGLQIDLRVVQPMSYGAALLYFTGSKAHGIALRKIAIGKGLKLNEYGIFRDKQYLAGRTEKEMYNQLGMAYIMPELREMRGEINAARRHNLPRLIESTDVRGDLHTHSVDSDGYHSIEQMAEAAIKCGYEYLAIADHSQHVTVAHGLDQKRLAEQIDCIDRLNATFDHFTILKSCEVDILEDGSLDLPDDILRRLDLTVCAIHYQFHLSRQRQTQRILRAMDNPYFTILAHPTGRLINKREPYEVNLERLMAAAKERGCIFEINAQPQRMDLSDNACKLAQEMGVKVAICTDAHHISHLNYMRLGVNQARRGWLQAADVVNTASLKDLRKMLKRK